MRNSKINSQINTTVANLNNNIMMDNPNYDIDINVVDRVIANATCYGNFKYDIKCMGEFYEDNSRLYRKPKPSTKHNVKGKENIMGTDTGDFSVQYHCPECEARLEQAVDGWVCTSCGAYFEATVRTVSHVEPMVVDPESKDYPEYSGMYYDSFVEDIDNPNIHRHGNDSCNMYNDPKAMQSRIVRMTKPFSSIQNNNFGEEDVKWLRGIYSKLNKDSVWLSKAYYRCSEAYMKAKESGEMVDIVKAHKNMKKTEAVAWFQSNARYLKGLYRDLDVNGESIEGFTDETDVKTVSYVETIFDDENITDGYFDDGDDHDAVERNYDEDIDIAEGIAIEESTHQSSEELKFWRQIINLIRIKPDSLIKFGMEASSGSWKVRPWDKYFLNPITLKTPELEWLYYMTERRANGDVHYGNIGAAFKNAKDAFYGSSVIIKGKKYVSKGKKDLIPDYDVRDFMFDSNHYMKSESAVKYYIIDQYRPTVNLKEGFCVEFSYEMDMRIQSSQLERKMVFVDHGRELSKVRDLVASSNSDQDSYISNKKLEMEEKGYTVIVRDMDAINNKVVNRVASRKAYESGIENYATFAKKLAHPELA